jgi:hypothetical protein
MMRTYYARGTPYEIGYAIGKSLGIKLENNIAQYIRQRPGQGETLDLCKLQSEALDFLNGLPKRFQDEFEGLADGADLPLQRLAEWAYVEECVQETCSGFVGRIDGRVWVARNNDSYVPELWGYLTIREVNGRIPALSFCMQGDVFTPTGMNREKLWLHYNYLRAWDRPRTDRPQMPGYVFLSEALETCRTIPEVERLLTEVDRLDGMLLFAVDGKTEEFALFECTCRAHLPRQPGAEWLVATNHACALTRPVENLQEGAETFNRFARMESLVNRLYAAQEPPRLPVDLIQILADEGIEHFSPEFGTVYSNVACPGSTEIWYTFGGYPAASRGNWQRLEWPWKG